MTARVYVNLPEGMWQWTNTYQSYDTIAKISQHIPIISTCVFILSMVAYIPVVVGLISLFLSVAIIIGCTPMISKSSPFMLVNQWCVHLHPSVIPKWSTIICIISLYDCYVNCLHPIRFSHHIPIISPHWLMARKTGPWPCDEITATKVIHSIWGWVKTLYPWWTSK